MNDVRHRVFITALIAQWIALWLLVSDQGSTVSMSLHGILGDMYHNDYVWLPIIAVGFAITALIAHAVQAAIFSGVDSQ